MNLNDIKDSCQKFAKDAAPFLNINDNSRYEQTLELVESLLEQAEDSTSDPLNSVIDMLGHAIEIYENSDEELREFEQRAMAAKSDVATLRLLMDQYDLSMSDIPEIGSKSMVSRVLSGERKMNTNHIKSLSERFNICPSIFF